jgi:glycopeptide antibiotics resistance protein
VFRQVPVLPVVVPSAAAVLLWHLRRRALLTAPRAAVALALCVYAAGVVANTVFPIYLDPVARSTRWSVQPVPFADYEWADAAMNVAVFVPLGILLALALGTPPWWRVLVAVAASSLAIELTQLVTGAFLGGGHVADVDDLLSNVTGGMLGLALLVGLNGVPAGARLVERSRWS